jgi:hypothetical protein
MPLGSVPNGRSSAGARSVLVEEASGCRSPSESARWMWEAARDEMVTESCYFAARCI